MFRAAWLALLPLLLLGLAAQAVTFTNDTVIPPGDITYDGLAIVVDGCTLTVDGPHAFASVRVLAGGELTHSAGAVYGGLNLTVAGDFEVAPGGAVAVTGRGYAAGSGPGAGGSAGNLESGGGGGHAGYGGAGIWTNLSGAGSNYGSVPQPTLPGSGGGGDASHSGGAGGGAVRLIVQGRLQLDGSILADGERPESKLGGGGAGGSVWLSVGELTGGGRISAGGGTANSPSSGGGSGGRIALYFDTNSFTGTITAFGGGGFIAGAAGTILTRTNSASHAQVLVDNGGLRGTNTWLTEAGNVHLMIQGGARATGIEEYARFEALEIRSNSALLASWPVQSVVVSGTAVVEQGAEISADGLGYASGQGPRPGRYYSCETGCGSGGGGAGYAGFGGRGFHGPPDAQGGEANHIYGPGSGGGGDVAAEGGSGGGVLFLRVSGSLQMDGRVSADGRSAQFGGAGGGAGGMLSVYVGQLSGLGVLSANGGDGHLPHGGGGGGGEVVVTAQTNSFSGTPTARGGGGYVTGGAGTILSQNGLWHFRRYIHDNGGRQGASTRFGKYTAYYSSTYPIESLRIIGGAMCVASDLSLNSKEVLVGSNSWVKTTSTGGSVDWQAWTNLTIEAGGGVSVDGGSRSYWTGRLQPNGSYDSAARSGGGGGHGGFGGRGASGVAAAGGDPHGNPQVFYGPSTGGRGGVSTNSALGEAWGGGGCRIRGILAATVRVDGLLTANGNPGLSPGAGGGAGGGILLDVAVITGTGVIAADGGAGNAPNGGGGGGGRIVLRSRTNSFSGSVSARGGPGHIPGGAGTIYREEIAGPLSLLVDNGGQRGAASLVFGYASGYPTPPPPDLTVQGSARVVYSYYNLPFIVSSLAVHPDSALLLSNSLSVLGDAMVHAGGELTADGLGHAANAGPGAGVVLAGQGAGGGHGGAGGASASGAPGGLVYGWALEPTTRGSGGGRAGYGGALTGSAGGGALRVDVGGTLTVDGRLSADGQAGWLDDAGGGAGGSVWITAGALTGEGAITARGGDGEWFNGGGGGGGRIAIYAASDTHSGLVSTLGGLGAVPGHPGSAVRGLSPNFELAVLPGDAERLRLVWRGCSGLVYQMEASTNLVHWTAFGPPLPGVNGWMEASPPLGPVPTKFFRVRAAE